MLLSRAVWWSTNEAQAIFESLEEIGKRRQFRIPLAMVYFGLAFIH
jgi:hypothetical protein